MMSFPSEKHASASTAHTHTHYEISGVNTVIHLQRGNWEKPNLPTLSQPCCMLIVPSDIHLHNGTAKKRLPTLILLMQLDYCLCAYNN